MYDFGFPQRYYPVSSFEGVSNAMRQWRPDGSYTYPNGNTYDFSRRAGGALSMQSSTETRTDYVVHRNRPELLDCCQWLYVEQVGLPPNGSFPSYLFYGNDADGYVFEASPLYHDLDDDVKLGDWVYAGGHLILPIWYPAINALADIEQPLGSLTVVQKHALMLDWLNGPYLDSIRSFIGFDLPPIYRDPAGVITAADPTSAIAGVTSTVFPEVVMSSIFTHINVIDGYRYMPQLFLVALSDEYEPLLSHPGGFVPPGVIDFTPAAGHFVGQCRHGLGKITVVPGNLPFVDFAKGYRVLIDYHETCFDPPPLDSIEWQQLLKG